jgi:hypothetical protein
VTRKLLAATVIVLELPLTLVISTHTVYVVPTFVPELGQVNVALEKLPPEIVGFDPEPTETNPEQEFWFGPYPNTTVSGVAEAGAGILEALTVIVAPVTPDVGLLVAVVCAAAATWKVWALVSI